MSTATDSTITTTLSPQPSVVHNKIPNEPTPPSAVVSESQPVVVFSEPPKAQQQTSNSEAMVNVKHKEIDKDGQENRKVESLIPKDTSQDTGEKQNVARQGEQITLSSSSKDQTR